MSAVLSMLPTAPAASAAIDWSQWIDNVEAARRLGVSRGQMRRQCSDRLAAQGLAMQAPSPEGRLTWYVARRLDKALCDGVIGSLNQIADLSRFTERQRRTAMLRVECVHAFREAREAGGSNWRRLVIITLRNRFPDLKVCERSLYRWDKLYRGKADIVRLIDSRGGDRRSQGDDEAWDFFYSLFLHQNQPSARDCWRKTRRWASQNGLTWCSYTSLCYQLDKRVPQQAQTKARDPKGFKQKFEPWIEQRHDRFAAGQALFGDHSCLDFLCRDGQRLFRPWISVWQDWRTRRICGWALVESPSSDSIRASLRMAILDPVLGGPPEVVWTDNGRDYQAAVFWGATKAERRTLLSKGYLDEPTFTGILRMLDIEAHFSLPFAPDGKAKIERFFGTTHGGFDKHWPSYCGRSPEHKPPGLAKLLKDHPEKVPTIHEVREAFARWVKTYNADAEHNMPDLVHEGVKISPDEAMTRWRERRRPLADPSILDLLMSNWHKPLTVGKNGITLRLGNVTKRYGQFSHELAPYKAGRAADRPLVIVAYDDNDMSQIRVFDPDMRYICTAVQNEQSGIHGAPVSKDLVKHVSQAKAQYRRAVQAPQKARERHPGIGLLNDDELLQAEADRRRQEADHDARLKPVRTALDGQGAVIARDDLRRAAGGESMSAAPDQRRGLTSPIDFAKKYLKRPMPAAPADEARPPADWLAFKAGQSRGNAGPQDQGRDDAVREQGATP
jgi:transposase InsO family protein